MKYGTPGPSSPSSSSPSSSSPSPDPIDAAGSIPSGEADDATRKTAVKVSSNAWAEIIRGLIAAIGLIMNSRLSGSELEQSQGVWITTDEDEKQIADPLASIVGRRTGTAGVDNPDLADLIASGVGTAGYLIANVTRSVRLRFALRRAGRGTPPVEPAPAEWPQQ